MATAARVQQPPRSWRPPPRSAPRLPVPSAACGGTVCGRGGWFVAATTEAVAAAAEVGAAPAGGSQGTVLRLCGDAHNVSRFRHDLRRCVRGHDLSCCCRH